MFTPRTPRLFVIFSAFVAASLLPLLGMSQDSPISKGFRDFYKVDSIMSHAIRERPSVEVFEVGLYYENYEVYCDSMKNAELLEYDFIKPKWWFYIPVVGWSFGKPSISLNSGLVKELYISRRAQTMKRNSIIQKWEYLKYENKSVIYNLHEKVIRLIQMKETDKAILLAWQMIDKDKTVHFVNTGQNPIEYLQHIIQYNQIKMSENERHYQISLALSNLEDVSKWGFGFICENFKRKPFL